MKVKMQIVQVIPVIRETFRAQDAESAGIPGDFLIIYVFLIKQHAGFAGQLHTSLRFC